MRGERSTVRLLRAVSCLCNGSNGVVAIQAVAKLPRYFCVSRKGRILRNQSFAKQQTSFLKQRDGKHGSEISYKLGY